MRKLEDWIEYIEGEGDPKRMSKLGMLLKHSSTDKLVVDNLRRLRRAVHEVDPADKINDVISNSDFLGDFHSRIMDALNLQTRSSAKKKDRSSQQDEGLRSSQGPYKRS
jgi:hypothetical protein